MSEPQASPASATIVVCEKHGLRYNSATHAGCVRCRKEAGETLTGGLPVSVPSAAKRAPAAVAAGSAPALGPALATTALLILAAGYGLFHVHKVVHGGLLATWGEVLGTMSGENEEAPSPLADPAGAEGESDPAGPYLEDDGSE